MHAKDAVSWFEIAVSDLAKSRQFYETVFQVELVSEDNEECRMLMFPFDEENGIGGCLSRMDGFSPGAGGTMVYLDARGDLDGALERAWQGGGRILRERTPIPPHGYFAHFEDPEGNPVGLFSQQ